MRPRILWAAVALGMAPAAAAQGAGCRPDRVELLAPDGRRAAFAVEVADSGEERARGLMFRESLPASAGMLFVYDRPQRASFWMRNTLIALDMIFLDPAGVVTRVHEAAVPLDETPIDGGPGVRYVLEINAGLARALGIVPGTRLRHPAVDPARAALPC